MIGFLVKCCSVVGKSGSVVELVMAVLVRIEIDEVERWCQTNGVGDQLTALC